MRRGGTVSGAVSLVMIFVVLCLTVFSVLTLSTAVGESKLAQATAQHTADYYASDAQATAIAAQLGQGSRAQEIDGIAIAYTTHADGQREIFPSRRAKIRPFRSSSCFKIKAMIFLNGS